MLADLVAARARAGSPARPAGLVLGALLAVVASACPGRGGPTGEGPRGVAAEGDAAPAGARAGGPADAATVASILRAHRLELAEAGDADRCDEAVARVRASLASDRRVPDEALEAELDRHERTKGPMPYPSPGTACSLFGFQRAVEAALADRRAPRP